MTICLFKTISFLLMAVAFLPLGVAQFSSMSTTYTTTTVYKTITVSAVFSTQSDTASFLPITGAGKVLTTDLPMISANDLTMPDVQTDSTYTSGGIVIDCQATPTDADSVHVTDITEATTTTMGNGVTITSSSVVSSTIAPSDAVVVDATTTSTSSYVVPTTVLTTQYVLSKSSASATYTNQYAALLLSNGNGGGKSSVASQMILAVVFLVFLHSIAMAFF